MDLSVVGDVHFFSGLTPKILGLTPCKVGVTPWKSRGNPEQIYEENGQENRLNPVARIVANRFKTNV